MMQNLNAIGFNNRAHLVIENGSISTMYDLEHKGKKNTIDLKDEFLRTPETNMLAPG